MLFNMFKGFASESFKFLLEKVTHLNGQFKNPDELKFLDTVLLPELHVQICMAVTGKTYADAEYFLENEYEPCEVGCVYSTQAEIVKKQ